MLGTATVAVALSLWGMVAANTWGSAAATAAAIVSGVGYGVLHAAPHGFPWTEDVQDAATVGLLVAVGLVAATARRERLGFADRARRRRYSLDRLHEVMNRAVNGAPFDEVAHQACDALRAELGLASCELVVTDEPASTPSIMDEPRDPDAGAEPSRHAGSPVDRHLAVVKDGHQVARFDLTLRRRSVRPAQRVFAASMADCVALAIHDRQR